jgi:hypothetical protein
VHAGARSGVCRVPNQHDRPVAIDPGGGETHQLPRLAHACLARTAQVEHHERRRLLQPRAGARVEHDERRRLRQRGADPPGSDELRQRVRADDGEQR